MCNFREMQIWTVTHILYSSSICKTTGLSLWHSTYLEVCKVTIALVNHRKVIHSRMLGVCRAVCMFLSSFFASVVFLLPLRIRRLLLSTLFYSIRTSRRSAYLGLLKDCVVKVLTCMILDQ